MKTLASILVHLDSSSHAAKRMQVARQLADAFDAETTVQYAVVSALQQYAASLRGGGQAVPIMEELDRARRAKAHRIFEAHAAGAPRLSWGEQLPSAPDGFMQRAFYADLLVLGQRDPDDTQGEDVPTDFVPDVMAATGKPTLLVPHAGPATEVGGTVLIAWKENREAARAVSAALPWLMRAKRVHALAYGDDAEFALVRLAGYLKHHGIDPVLHADRDTGDVGERLLSRAADLNGQLLVMGCYHHSRLRELLLGGSTRTLLERMTLPVLMAH
ncbi:hypothetical protein RD110_22550 [Rhodoferax koreense]|uniref:UspA domain-containing protein n=1 Tax=Rhodoferax koreensis TaxID=1842727 RepID=A0A1P8K0W8_9BURK|nr:universal stress protein [Rhodoferax koreense]APW39642.1 hypothetical protein RD110_22550 [Rhodoferax koreense]